LGWGRLLALVAALLLLPACRDNSPYADFKPAHLLDEGQRLLGYGDLDGAEKALRLGLTRAEKSGIDLGRSREAFLVPLFHLAVKRGDTAEAGRILARMGTPVDVRAAHQVAVLTSRSGNADEARAKGEIVAAAIAARTPTDDETRAIDVAAWTTIDRLRSARFDRAGAREATDAVIAGLTDLAEYRGAYRPMPPGLRGWITRYIDHLFATDRDLIAKDVAGLVERIDENAPSPDDDALCLPLYKQWRNLGCLLEISP
jgi:hypothetical protein